MTKNTLPKAIDAKALGALIASTIKAAASASINAHNAAYHALAHIIALGADGKATGDSRPLARLVSGLSKTGFNVKGLAYAISRYTPVTFDKNFDLTVHKPDSVRYARIAEGNGGNAWNLPGFYSDPFWGMAAVKNDQKPVNFGAAQVLRFVAKMGDKTAQSLADGKITPAEAEEATKLEAAIVAAVKGAGFGKQLEAIQAKVAA